MSNAIPSPAKPKHPNREPFTGVLTHVEVASDKPPAGSRDHRVLLDRAATEEALESLINMAVDYKDGYEGHDTRQKIGVITAAWLEGDAVHVSGYLWARDFEHVVRSMRSPARPLGMSYELAGVHVEDMTAPVWRLKQFVFTGAAILYCDKAAYRSSSFCILASADEFSGAISFIDSCDVTGMVD